MAQRELDHSNPDQRENGVSVIMPVYNQAHFIRRAIKSLQAQRHSPWELIVVNDGSTDGLQTVLAALVDDEKISVVDLPENVGLGAALNIGLARACFPLIAYLPADDVWYPDHLSTLVQALGEGPANVLAFSGVRHHYNKTATGRIDDYPLQLVQVVHRETGERWVERHELVTDDLSEMLWKKIAKEKTVVGTGEITCEWVDHPHQRHKIIREPEGGINPYKLFYRVQHPLRYKSSVGNFIDELAYNEPFRNVQVRVDEAPLKILLVGELAYNAERVLTFAERGHRLYGLWMKTPYWYNTIGPLPFGHVTDIPTTGWQEKVKAIKPDIVYGLLNWQAVPFAHEVMKGLPEDVPFVWHFKEGPFICLEKGTWRELIELYENADGQIYSSPEMRDWFLQFLSPKSPRPFVLDGDLPKREWFCDNVSPRLSAGDGAIHTVVPGRPIGLHPHTVEELARHNIHLHFYGDFTHGQWKEWIRKALLVAPGHLHIHANCSQPQWVKEFSQYDAGWLHFFQSKNRGALCRANWDDLNYPARMATLAVAGLPMLQRDNTGHIVATQSLVQQFGLGLFFIDIADLAGKLKVQQSMNQLRDNVWANRHRFSFDYHADGLIRFFRQVATGKYRRGTAGAASTSHSESEVRHYNGATVPSIITDTIEK